MQPHEYSMNSTTAQARKCVYAKCVACGAARRWWKWRLSVACSNAALGNGGDSTSDVGARSHYVSRSRRCALRHCTWCELGQSQRPGQNDPAVEARVRRHCYGLEPGRITVTSSWPLGRNDNSSTVKVQVRYAYTSAAGALIGGATWNSAPHRKC
jgi:hypothetical protein